MDEEFPLKKSLTVSSKGIGTLLLAISAGILIWRWITETGASPTVLLYEVVKWANLPVLETPFLYLYIHLCCVLPVLALSFDRKVAYYKKWFRLFPPLMAVAVFFILWDVQFTHWNVWNFNEHYFLGYRLYGLPIEEVLFFISIPFCVFFIYECLNAYFPNWEGRQLDQILTPFLIILFFVLGFCLLNRIYTATACLLSGLVLAAHYLYSNAKWRPLFYRAYLVSLLPFQLVNGILTGGYTKEPVVLYDPSAYLD